MSYNHDARSAWASQTIKKTMRNLNQGVLVRSNSSLHAYPAVGFCQVRIQKDSSGELGNVEISRTVPRVDIPHYNFSLENSVLEKIKQMEDQDQIVAENRVKFLKAKKYREEQAEKVKNVAFERKKRDEERKKMEEERKKIEEHKAEEKEKAEKLTQYGNVTGVWDGNKVREALKKHAWNLNTAISEYFSKSEEPSNEGRSQSQNNTVKITIYIDNEKHEWTYKSSETLWDLYTMVARSGKNEAFHFVDSNGKKYKEHMFDTTLANAGWVPAVTLTVCKDEHKLDGFK